MERKNRVVTGNYLNSTDALTAYTEVYKSPYFVDKSEVLNEIIPRIGTTEKYICITRPRRLWIFPIRTRSSQQWRSMVFWALRRDVSEFRTGNWWNDSTIYCVRDSYRVEREDKAGTGYVDFIFYPEMDRRADGIILELKVDHSVDEAIRQMKEKRYALKFESQIGGKPRYTGRVLGVGIAYDRKTKKHKCKIEVLRDALTNRCWSWNAMTEMIFRYNPESEDNIENE